MDEKFFEGVVAGFLPPPAPPPPDPSPGGSLQVRDDLLDIYNLTNIKEASAVVDLQRLEVLAGSYFAMAGAFAGILKPGRMIMFGTLLIMWGLAKDRILGKSANSNSSRSVSVYPTMGIALICALSSIKYNMKKATRPAPARTLEKPLQSSSKSKLK